MYCEVSIDKIHIQRSCQTTLDGMAGKKLIDILPHIEEFQNIKNSGCHSQKYIDFLKDTIIKYEQGDLIENQLAKHYKQNEENYINSHLKRCKDLYELINESREIYPISLLKITDNYYITYQGHHRVALSYVLGLKKINAFIYDICEDTNVPIPNSLIKELKNVHGVNNRELVYLPINSLLNQGWILFRKSSYDKLRYIAKYILENYTRTIKVLEIGCNSGYFSRMLIKLGFINIISIEILESMYKVANYLSEYISIDTLFKPYRYNLEYKNISIEDFQETDFCIILFTDIIHHIPITNRINIMKKLNNILKKDGSIICTKGNLCNNEWYGILKESNLYEDCIIYTDNDNGYNRDLIILKKYEG